MFYIDGVSNVDLGVVAEEENFLSRAPINFEEIAIEGKNGSDYVEKNYMNVTGTLVLYLVNRSKLDLAKQAFNGTREIVHDGRKSKIRFYEQNEIVRYGTTKSFTVNFIRDPFWYVNNDEYVEVTDIVSNKGTEKSLPIIKLIGVANTDLDITIANVRFTYHFDDDVEVIIDCEKQTETSNGISKSKNIEIGFEYPCLEIGANDITIHSGECSIFMMRKDVYL